MKLSAASIREVFVTSIGKAMADTAAVKASPLKLEFTCSNKWQGMAGDERIRNCDQCNCNVQRIDHYSALEMEELQNRIDAGEKVCVAFTAPDDVNHSPKSSKAFSTALAASSVSILLVLSLNLSGCAVHDPSPKISESTKKAIKEGVTYDPSKAHDAGVINVGRPAKSSTWINRQIEHSSEQDAK